MEKELAAKMSPEAGSKEVSRLWDRREKEAPSSLSYWTEGLMMYEAVCDGDIPCGLFSGYRLICFMFICLACDS